MYTSQGMLTHQGKNNLLRFLYEVFKKFEHFRQPRSVLLEITFAKSVFSVPIKGALTRNLLPEKLLKFRSYTFTAKLITKTY